MIMRVRSDSTPQLIDDEMHRQVLSAGTDVPEQVPSFAIALDDVGIGGKTVWVKLPEGRIPFTATLTVDLPADVRGIHMSRLEQSVARLYEVPFDRLTDYARELHQEMVLHQQSGAGTVLLTGKRPLFRQSKISHLLSVDSLDVRVEVKTDSRDVNKVVVSNGIGACHITACPCTLAYNGDVFSGPRECPMPTHSQRSQTWLHLSSSGYVPGYEDLLGCLEKSLHLTQDLLKRPDEAEIVLKSHSQPQFAEDVVRETAQAVGLQFQGKLSAGTKVLIESLSLESIHIHDVCCRLKTTLGEICACL